MSPTKRPDIMVMCDPCPNAEKNQAGDPVQKFRWRDGEWLPKDTSGEKWTHVGGPQPPYATAEDIANAPAGRGHLNVKCDYCGGKVVMQWSRAQLALTALWAEAEEMFAKLGLQQQPAVPLRFTLRHLERRYNSLPPQAARALPGRHPDR